MKLLKVETLKSKWNLNIDWSIAEIKMNALHKRKHYFYGKEHRLFKKELNNILRFLNDIESSHPKSKISRVYV